MNEYIPFQQSLWTNPIMDIEKQHIKLTNGELIYFPSLLSPERSTYLFQQLQQHVDWQQDSLNISGKNIPIPRLQAWYGDDNCFYQYSGLKLKPLKWTSLLQELKDMVQQYASCEFNSVLINYYRTGMDSVSWHSDDEKELGKNPTIASVSLGEKRRFCLKHKVNKKLPVVNMNLNNGSLLIMQKTTQHFWYHQLPKTRKNIGPRINLTFRKIIT